jgi:signal peptidase
MLQHHATAPTRPADRRRAGRWRGLGSWAFFLVALAVAVFLWPHQWGGSTSLTIVSGHSMDGTFATGDLVIGREGPVEVGDVIVFRPQGLDGHVVHRVVGGDAESGWVTRGDNNDWDDPFRPTSDDVIGVVHWRVPQMWVLVKLATSPLAIVAYALVVAGVFLWPSRRTAAGPDDADPAADEVDPDGTVPDAADPAAHPDDATPRPTRAPAHHHS